ncbi:MAG: hypothetical protein ACOVMP_02560 [Chthoniobacterales bacterium]
MLSAALLVSTAFGQVPAAGDTPANPTPAATPQGLPTPDPDAPMPGAPDFETITYWKAELPGGTYIIAHDSVNGVSSQEYILDGTARVTEVNISTSGVMQSRFYYIEPLTPIAPVAAAQGAVDRTKSALEEAASRLVPGDPVWSKVIKTYPTTTHAGTIEYRLETKQQIENLYKSLESSWIAGRSEVFRPEGGGKGFNPRELKKKQQEENGEGGEPSGSPTPENEADAFSGGL